MMKIIDVAFQTIQRLYTEHLSDVLGDEVYHHSYRVCEYSLLVADYYEFNLQEKIDIAIGSLLHDIGKSYVNQCVLNKTETLTRDDRILIECHPQHGFLLVENLGFNDRVLDIIHHHHERLNASGYPDRLHEENISIYTQIVAVADVYDALTSDRVYHKKVSKEKAFSIMRKDDGLNQTVVEILYQLT